MPSKPTMPGHGSRPAFSAVDQVVADLVLDATLDVAGRAERAQGAGKIVRHPSHATPGRGDAACRRNQAGADRGGGAVGPAADLLAPAVPVDEPGAEAAAGEPRARDGPAQQGSGGGGVGGGRGGAEHDEVPPHRLDRARGGGDDELAQGAAGGQPDRAQRAAVDREDGGHGVGRGGQGDAPAARGREAGDGEIAADGDQHAAARRLGHRLGAALDRDRRQRRARVEVEGATAAAAGLQPVEGGQAVVDDAVGRSGGDAVGEAGPRATAAAARRRADAAWTAGGRRDPAR